MRRSLRAALALAGWAAGGLGGGAAAEAAAGPASDSCVSCHAKDDDEEVSACVGQWRKSVHFAAEVTCDGCHGGNPRARDEDGAHAASAGWVGTPGWKELPGFCGACHDSIAKAFEDGAFAAALPGGAMPPTCVTCHMATGHDTQRADPGRILPDPLPDRLRAVPQVAETRRIAVPLFEREAEVRREVEALARRPLPPSGVERDLAGVHDRFVPRVHRFEPAALAADAALARAGLAAVERRTARLEQEAGMRIRLGAGGLAMLGLAFGGLLAFRSRRSS